MNDLFLDMCIIIYYAKYNPELENCRKITNLIKNKKEINFLTCCYILEINLPKWINRQKIVVEELKRKVKDNSYEIGASYEGKILIEREINECKKLFNESIYSENRLLFIETIEKNVRVVEERIRFFIDKILDKKVIPVSTIDFELKSSLFTYLDSNDSDAKTLASAVQEHNIEPLTILTTDKKHWTKQLLEDSISIHPALRKKYPKIPEIKYL